MSSPAFCAAARQHGNGVIEIRREGQLASARADASLRSAIRVPYVIVARHRILGEGVPVIGRPALRNRFRRPSSTPIPSRGPAPGRRRKEIALAPKVSVVVDGGGGLHLDALNADIRLRAVATLSGPMLHVALGRRCGLGDNARSGGARPMLVLPLQRSFSQRRRARPLKARARSPAQHGHWRSLSCP